MPPAGSKVTLGVRPEHIDVTPGDTMAIELTEALGGVSYDYIQADTGERLIVEERGDHRSAPGARVALSFDPARAYLFDADTGARIR